MIFISRACLILFWDLLVSTDSQPAVQSPICDINLVCQLFRNPCTKPQDPIGSFYPVVMKNLPGAKPAKSENGITSVSKGGDSACPLAAPFMYMDMGSLLTGYKTKCCFQFDKPEVWPKACYPNDDLNLKCPKEVHKSPAFTLDITRDVTVKIRPASQGSVNDQSTISTVFFTDAGTISSLMSKVPTHLYLPKYWQRPVFAKSPRIARILLFAAVGLVIFVIYQVLETSAEAELISSGKFRERDIEAANESDSSRSSSPEPWENSAEISRFSLPSAQVTVITPEGSLAQN